MQIQTGCPTTQRTTRRTLVRVLETILRLLHPIMPFITEELWQVVAPLANAKTADSIMLAAYPQADKEQIVQTAFDKMAALKDLVEEVRKLRGEMGIAPQRQSSSSKAAQNSMGLLKYLPSLTRLTEAKLVDSLRSRRRTCRRLQRRAPDAESRNRQARRNRPFNKKPRSCKKALDKLNAKLSNPATPKKSPGAFELKRQKPIWRNWKTKWRKFKLSWRS